MTGLNETLIGAVITDAFAVRAADGTCSTIHVQHGTAVLVAVDAEVVVTAPGLRTAGRVVVVPPDLPHAVVCQGPMVGLLFDPEAAPQVASFARASARPVALGGALQGRFTAAVAAHGGALARGEVLDGLAREALTWLTQGAARRRIDRRVAHVLAVLDAGRELAPCDLGGLSRAHLQALFVRDIGVPIRRLRLWRRLLVAVAGLARHDVTAAAHLAGFADLAHFSRTCRRMLGYTPTALRTGLLPVGADQVPQKVAHTRCSRRGASRQDANSG